MKKKCSTCKRERSLLDFANNRTNKDGKSYQCRDCHTEQNRKWRQKNPGAKREEDKRKVAKDKLSGKHSFYALFHYATGSGKILPKPCAVCGEVKAQAHHYLGYEREHIYDVIWLCSVHHGQYHKYEKSIIETAKLEERKEVIERVRRGIHRWSQTMWKENHIRKSNWVDAEEIEASLQSYCAPYREENNPEKSTLNTKGEDKECGEHCTKYCTLCGGDK